MTAHAHDSQDKHMALGMGPPAAPHRVGYPLTPREIYVIETVDKSLYLGWDERGRLTGTPSAYNVSNPGLALGNVYV